MSQEQLQDRLQYWQKVLRLENWDVKVKIDRVFNLHPNTQGCCEWTLSRMEALIRILDPADWDPSCIYPQDMETTLVHELLHLHGARLPTMEENSPGYIALEQMIHHCAYALTALDGRGCRQPRRRGHKSRGGAPERGKSAS